jgi:ABC-type transport system involved in cytochrome bd biosynthesis fused ATPase/permease subunit
MLKNISIFGRSDVFALSVFVLFVLASYIILYFYLDAHFYSQMYDTLRLHLIQQSLSRQSSVTDIPSFYGVFRDDVEEMVEHILRLVDFLAQVIIVGLTSIFILSQYNLVVFAVLLSSGLINLIFISFKTKIQATQSQMRQIMINVTNQLLEILSNKSMLRSFGAHGFALRKIFTSLDSRISAVMSNFKIVLVANTISNSMYAITYCIFIFFLLKNTSKETRLADFALLVPVFTKFIDLSKGLFNLQTSFARNNVSESNFTRFLSNHTTGGLSRKHDKKLSEDILISVDDLHILVSRDNFVLSCPLFEVKRFKSHYLIGANGTGKTVFLLTLMGEFSDASGEIVYFKPVSEINFGFIHHSPKFFAGSIRDNLVLGQNISDSSVYNALKLAHFEELVLIKDIFLDMIDEEASMFSTGQRYRLSLARAILQNPDVLIVENIFGSLDVSTANIILRNFHDNKTTAIFTFHSESNQLTTSILQNSAQSYVIANSRIQPSTGLSNNGLSGLN